VEVRRGPKSGVKGSASCYLTTLMEGSAPSSIATLPLKEVRCGSYEVL